MFKKRSPYDDGLMLTDCVDVMDPVQSKLYCFMSGDGGGGSDSSNSNQSSYEDEAYGGGSSSGGGNFSSGGGGSSGSDDSGGGGTVFGVNGHSKTGSTSADAAIGWTSGEGSGTAGSNYDALSGATTSEVDYARDMADRGASQDQIADYLATGRDSTSSAEAGTAGGNTVTSAVQATAQQTLGRKGSTASQISKRAFDNTTNTLTGGVSSGFNAFLSSGQGPLGAYSRFGGLMEGAIDPQTLALESRLDRRGDYDENVTGLTNALVPGTSIGNRRDAAGNRIMENPKFYREDGAGVRREMAPLGSGGLVAGTDGAFALITPKDANKLAKDYNIPNLRSVDNRLRGDAITQLFAANPDVEIGRMDQKLGGQSVVRNQRIVDYNPATGSYMIEGGSKGFFGSVLSSLFGLGLTGPASMAFSGAGLANKAKNMSLDKDTAGILGLGADLIGLPGSMAVQGSRMAGFNLNNYLPQFQSSRSRNRSMFSDDSGDDNRGGTSAPTSVPTTTPTQTPGGGTQVSLPTTAATALTRRKRMPGSDVYGVTTNDFPFLALSDELEFSNLGSASGKGRSGGFKQASTAR